MDEKIIVQEHFVGYEVNVAKREQTFKLNTHIVWGHNVVTENNHVMLIVLLGEKYRVMCI